MAENETPGFEYKVFTHQFSFGWNRYWMTVCYRCYGIHISHSVSMLKDLLHSLPALSLTHYQNRNARKQDITSCCVAFFKNYSSSFSFVYIIFFPFVRHMRCGDVPFHYYYSFSIFNARLSNWKYGTHLTNGALISPSRHTCRGHSNWISFEEWMNDDDVRCAQRLNTQTSWTSSIVKISHWADFKEREVTSRRAIQD